MNRNTWKLTLTPNGKLGAIKSKLKNLNPRNKQATFYQVMKENNLKSVSGQKNFNSLLNVLANNPTRHKNVITKVYNTVYKTSKRAKKKNKPLLGPVKPQGKKTQQQINKNLTAGMVQKINPVKLITIQRLRLKTNYSLTNPADHLKKQQLIVKTAKEKVIILPMEIQ